MRGGKVYLPSLHLGWKSSIYLFLERGEREGEREGEKHQCVFVSGAPPTEDLAYNPGMCLVWESNQQHFGSLAKLNPLSHTSQGPPLFLMVRTLKINSLIQFQVYIIINYSEGFQCKK